MVSTDPVWYYFPPWMLWQNRGMWSRRNSVCSESRPKAFDMSSGIPKLPITSWSVDNIYNRVLCCKSISINYNMHGWFLCWQHATGWVWWKSGLRAVAMWSSSSFTKRMDSAHNIWDVLHAAIIIIVMWKMVPVVFVWRQRFWAGFCKLINHVDGTTYGRLPSDRLIEEWLWDTNTLGISQVLEACRFDDLTHWGRVNIDAVSQTTFSNAFSSMKIVVF